MNDLGSCKKQRITSKATSNPQTLHYDFAGRTHERPIQCTQEAVATWVTTSGNRETTLSSNIIDQEGLPLMAMQQVDEPAKGYLAICNRRVKMRHKDSVRHNTNLSIREAFRLKAVQGRDELVQGYLAVCDRVSQGGTSGGPLLRLNTYKL